MQRTEEFCNEIDLRLKGTMNRYIAAVFAAALVFAAMIYKYAAIDDFIYDRLHSEASISESGSFEMDVLACNISKGNVKAAVSVSNNTDEEFILDNSNITLIILDTDSGSEPVHYPIAPNYALIKPHSYSVITIMSDRGDPIPFDEFRAALSVKLEDDSNFAIMLN